MIDEFFQQWAQEEKAYYESLPLGLRPFYIRAMKIRRIELRCVIDKDLDGEKEWLKMVKEEATNERRDQDPSNKV